jgi:methanethiol S-methyltransferase
MARSATVLYGITVYVLFLGTISYAVGFVGDFVVPKTIDAAPRAASVAAVLVDVLLVGAFAVQHTLMTRAGFKRWWTRIVPPVVERSTYLFFASLALLLIYWQWRPIATPVWRVDDPVAAYALRAVFAIGWVIVLVSTFLINHFELFGLQQVMNDLRGRVAGATEFRTPSLYRYVRHPLYLGFLLALWATPAMSAGHLMFSAATTGYILADLIPFRK